MRAPILVLVLSVTLLAEAQDLPGLLQLLQQPSTAVPAEAELEQLGVSDPRTRRMLSEQLPALLASGDVTSSASLYQLSLYAQLAGRLRLVSTIPQLGKLIAEPKSVPVITTTFYEAAQITRDPFSEALARIGDPAVPELTRLLDDSRCTTRDRAIRALLRIDSPSAREALRRHVAQEQNPGLEEMIREHAGP